MIVVSNTSVLLNLAVIGRLDILHQLYDNILVPKAVTDELARNGQAAVSTLEWIQIRPVTDQVHALSLQNILDIGEAESIVLAREVKADLLLIDERKGRSVALGFGLRLVGLLGILLVAKKQGMLTEIRPIVDELIAKAGFWVSQELYNKVLQLAGE